MAQLGADVDALDGLARRFNTAVTELQGIMNSIGSQVTGAWWQGADADNFRSQWEGQYRSQINNLMNAFQEAGTAVTNQASQQRQASGG